MKLTDIGKKIKDSCNWAFNNNGIEIDPNRIRLCDGSPIHSVGTTRLRSKWPYALAIVAPITTNYALDKDADIFDYAFPALSISALYILRQQDKKHLNMLKMDTNTLCINKKPDKKLGKNTSPTSPAHMFIMKNNVEKDKASAYSFSSLEIASWLVIENTSVLANTLDRARVAYTYGKVAKEDWVIEEMPKPKVKEPKEISLPEPDMA